MNPDLLNKKLGIEGFMHPDELDALMELACNKDVLEIGSYKGSSARWMACVARSVMCVDTFKACDNGQDQTGDTLAAFLKATERFKNVIYFQVSSKDAADLVLIDNQFDLIFLDAMHTYEDVKSDIQMWWPRLRSGGVMAFHDYGHDDFPGVKKAVDEWFDSVVSSVEVYPALLNPAHSLAWVTKL